MKATRLLFTAVLMISLSVISLSACTTKTSGTSIYGKVTAINGSELTIAVGTLNEAGKGTTDTTAEASRGSNQAATTQTDGTSTNSPPTPPTDSGAGAPSAPPADSGTGTAAAPPTDGSQASPSGTAPVGMPEILTLTGETKTITLSDTVPITKQSVTQISSGSANSTTDSIEATAADISVGTVLKITTKSNSEEIESIEIVY